MQTLIRRPIHIDFSQPFFSPNGQEIFFAPMVEASGHSTSVHQLAGRTIGNPDKMKLQETDLDLLGILL
ncbi:hypothetical protein [Spirosoma panaciterrae]|uniref:hypothetical protein n=1 Tax=Spirosoma panaciterrae TaxID=496058 RepID=UPI00037F11AF|nr:hypothetical protein [Spirosoma panaciterrae]